MKTIHAILLAALGCFTFANVACSADPSVDDDEGLTADQLSENATRLVGSYQDKGTAAKPPTFKGLVLQADGTFFADIDAGGSSDGIPIRIAGTFRVGRYLTLSPTSDASRTTYHGRYAFTLQGEKLSLTRGGSDWEGWADSLSKEDSYCAAPVDCSGQSLRQPKCLGAWSCSEQNACNFTCGASTCTSHTDQTSCRADTKCFAQMGPSSCTPDGRCTKDFVFKGCVDAPVATTCEDHTDQTSCRADTKCFAQMGPSSCTPDGRCTKDFVFKGCVDACETHTNEDSCSADSRCEPQFMPRPCPPGMFCPADMVFAECTAK